MSACILATLRIKSPLLTLTLPNCEGYFAPRSNSKALINREEQSEEVASSEWRLIQLPSKKTRAYLTEFIPCRTNKYYPKREEMMEIEEQPLVERRARESSGWEEVVKITMPGDRKAAVVASQKKGGISTIASSVDSSSFLLGVQTFKNIEQQIDGARDAILGENFEELTTGIETILSQRIPDSGCFLSFIQLLVDKSHLDLLRAFNCQLSILMEKNLANLKVIRYSGNSNQLFKMLTHFKEKFSEALTENPSVELILCVFDGAYNLPRQDMADLGKFLSEEYENTLNNKNLQIVIIIPMSVLLPISDVQVFSLEFAKSKDLFVRFILFLLQSENIPLPSRETLLEMLNEFDLYAISYSEQVRRVKLLIANKFAAGVEVKGKLFFGIFQADQQKKYTASENKIARDHLKRRSEIKAAVYFLEQIFGRLGDIEGEGSGMLLTTSSIVETKYRIAEIALNQFKKFFIISKLKILFDERPMEGVQYFIKCMREAQELCNDYQSKEGVESKEQEGCFSRYIALLKEFDATKELAIQVKIKQVGQAGMSRYEKQQLNKQQSSIKTGDESMIAQVIREKVEAVVRELVAYAIHQNYKTLAQEEEKTPLAISEVQQGLYRPDFAGEIFEEAIRQRNIERMEETDGMMLLRICEESGRQIPIRATFAEFKGETREKRGWKDENLMENAFHNAVCELKFKGLVVDKKKLNNKLGKHFFAKTSFFGHLQTGVGK